MFLQNSVVAKRFQARPVPVHQSGFQVGPYRIENPLSKNNRAKRAINTKSVEVQQRSQTYQVQNPWHIVGIFGGDDAAAGAIKEKSSRGNNSSLNQSWCQQMPHQSQRSGGRENNSNRGKATQQKKTRGYPNRSRTVIYDLPSSVYDQPNQVNIVSKDAGQETTHIDIQKTLLHTQQSSNVNEMCFDPSSDNMLKTSTLSRIPTQIKEGHNTVLRKSEEQQTPKKLTNGEKEALLAQNSSTDTVPIGVNTKVVLSVGETLHQRGKEQVLSSYDKSIGGVIDANDFAIVEQNQDSCLDLDQKAMESDSIQISQMVNDSQASVSFERPNLNKKQRQLRVTNIDFKQAKQFRMQRSGVENPKSQITFKLPSYSSCLRARVIPKNFPALKHYYELLAKDEKAAKINQKLFFEQFEHSLGRPHERRCASTMEQPRQGHQANFNNCYVPLNGQNESRQQRQSVSNGDRTSLRGSQEKRQVLLGNKNELLRRSSVHEISESEDPMQAIFIKNTTDREQQQPHVTSFVVGSQVKHQLALKSMHLVGNADNLDYDANEPSMGTFQEQSDERLKEMTVLSRKSMEQAKTLINIKHLSTLKSNHASMNRIGPSKQITHQTLNLSSKLLIGPRKHVGKKQPGSTKSGIEIANQDIHFEADGPYDHRQQLPSDQVQTKLASQIGSDGIITEYARPSSNTNKRMRKKPDTDVFVGERKFNNVISESISYSNEDDGGKLITAQDKQIECAFKTNDLYSSRSRHGDDDEDVESGIPFGKNSREALELQHSPHNKNTKETLCNHNDESLPVEIITFDANLQHSQKQAQSLEVIQSRPEPRVFDSKGFSTIRQQHSFINSPEKQNTIRADAAELKQIHIVAAPRQPNKKKDSEIKRKQKNDIRFNRTHNRKMAQTPELASRRPKFQQQSTDVRIIEIEQKDDHHIIVKHHDLKEVMGGSHADDPSINLSQNQNNPFLQIVQGQKSSVNESEMLGLLDLYLSRADLSSGRGASVPPDVNNNLSLTPHELNKNPIGKEIVRTQEFQMGKLGQNQNPQKKTMLRPNTMSGATRVLSRGRILANGRQTYDSVLNKTTQSISAAVSTKAKVSTFRTAQGVKKPNPVGCLNVTKLKPILKLSYLNESQENQLVIKDEEEEGRDMHTQANYHPITFMSDNSNQDELTVRKMGGNQLNFGKIGNTEVGSVFSKEEDRGTFGQNAEVTIPIVINSASQRNLLKSYGDDEHTKRDSAVVSLCDKNHDVVSLDIEHVVSQKRRTESSAGHHIQSLLPRKNQKNQYSKMALSSESQQNGQTDQALITATDVEGQTPVQTLNLVSDPYQSIEGGNERDNTINSGAFVKDNKFNKVGLQFNKLHLAGVQTPNDRKEKDSTDRSSFRIQNRTPDFLKVLGGGQDLIDSLMPQLASSQVKLNSTTPQEGDHAGKAKNVSSVYISDIGMDHSEQGTLSIQGEGTGAKQGMSPKSIRKNQIPEVRVHSRESVQNSSRQRQLLLYLNNEERDSTAEMTGAINVKDYFELRNKRIKNNEYTSYEANPAADIVEQPVRPRTHHLSSYTVPACGVVETRGQTEMAYQLHKRFVSKKRNNFPIRHNKSTGLRSLVSRASSQERPQTMVQGKRLKSQTGQSVADSAAYQAFLEEMMEKRKSGTSSCVVKAQLQGCHRSIPSTHTTYQDGTVTKSVTDKSSHHIRQSLASGGKSKRLETLENSHAQIAPTQNQKIIGVIGDFASEKNVLPPALPMNEPVSSSLDAANLIERLNHVAVRVNKYEAKLADTQMISQDNQGENSLRKLLSEDNQTEHLIKNNLAENSQEFTMNVLPNSTVRKDNTLHSEIESSPSLNNYGNISQIHHIYNENNSEEGFSAKLKPQKDCDTSTVESKESVANNKTSRLTSKRGSKARQLSSTLLVKKGIEHRSVNSIEKESILATKVKFNGTQRKQVETFKKSQDYSPSHKNGINSRDFTIRMTSKDNQTEYEETQHPSPYKLNQLKDLETEKKSVSVGTANPYADRDHSVSAKELNDMIDTQEVADRMNVMVQEMSINSMFGSTYELPSSWKNKIPRGIIKQNATMYRYQPRNKFQVYQPGGKPQTQQFRRDGSREQQPLKGQHLKQYFEQGGAMMGQSKMLDSKINNHSMHVQLPRHGADGSRCRTTEPGKHRNFDMATPWVLNDSPLHISGNQPVATTLQQFMPSTNAEKYISVFDERQFEAAAQLMYKAAARLKEGGQHYKSVGSVDTASAGDLNKPQTIMTSYNDTSLIIKGPKTTQIDLQLLNCHPMYDCLDERRSEFPSLGGNVYQDFPTTMVNTELQTIGNQVVSTKHGQLQQHDAASINSSLQRNKELDSHQRSMEYHSSLQESSKVDAQSPIHLFHPKLQLRTESQYIGEQTDEGTIRSSFEQPAQLAQSNKNNQLKIITMNLKDASGVSKTKSVEALFEIDPQSQQITIRTKNISTDGISRQQEVTQVHLNDDILQVDEKCIVETEELATTLKSIGKEVLKSN